MTKEEEELTAGIYNPENPQISAPEEPDSGVELTNADVNALSSVETANRQRSVETD